MMKIHAQGVSRATMCGNGRPEETLPSATAYFDRITCPDCVREMVSDARRRDSWARSDPFKSMLRALEAHAFAIGA